LKVGKLSGRVFLQPAFAKLRRVGLFLRQARGQSQVPRGRQAEKGIKISQGFASFLQLTLNTLNWRHLHTTKRRGN
jgi:hypothetical protein